MIPDIQSDIGITPFGMTLFWIFVGIIAVFMIGTIVGGIMEAFSDIEKNKRALKRINKKYHKEY